ncbi:MAG: hypothetical protein VB064_03470 [Oscillospiraceae bacterium]|nr:hypothetical protein [Oscillospiraceae bacterium]
MDFCLIDQIYPSALFVSCSSHYIAGVPKRPHGNFLGYVFSRTGSLCPVRRMPYNKHEPAACGEDPEPVGNYYIKTLIMDEPTARGIVERLRQSAR